MKLLTVALVAALSLFLAASALAADTPQIHLAAGANGAWLDGPGSAWPADFEGGGSAWSSLSPHISAVGHAWYGFSHSYVRWDGGVRVTTSDVLNPNFNTYLGLVFRGGSTSAVSPNEWAGDAGFGWKPSPTNWPRFSLGGDAGYGLDSKRILVQLGARYEIPLN